MVVLSPLLGLGQEDPDTSGHIDPVTIYVTKQTKEGLYWTQEDGWWIFGGKKIYLKFFEDGTVIYYRSSVKPEVADKRMKSLGADKMKDMMAGNYVLLGTDMRIFIDDLNDEEKTAEFRYFSEFETLIGDHSETSVALSPTQFTGDEIQSDLVMRLWSEEQ